VTVDGVDGLAATMGQDGVDRMLRHVAQHLAGHVRATDFVGRLGGRSFGVMLAYADPAGAERKIARLCKRIEETAHETYTGSDGIKLGWQVKPLD
jgi:diguanylate cyclase (GGDEF)-like protein